MGNKQSGIARKASEGKGMSKASEENHNHLFSHEELKSVRLVALQGPFVDAKTGELLAAFYAKHCPEYNTPEKIATIVESGMEVRMLNEKLRAKYGVDLNDFQK